MSAATNTTLPTVPRALRQRAFPAIPSTLQNPDILVRLSLSLILAAAVFEGLLLAVEIAFGVDHEPLQMLTVLALTVILVCVMVTARILRRRIGELEELSAGLEAALRGKETAEAANQAKARYLANVSHEIRSPLNAIYGYAQLVEQQADVPPQQAARVIRRCAEHLTSLVESLLDISRMENGRLTVRSEVVQLPDFLDQIVWMMRPAAEAKGLTFEYELPARLPEFVRTDQSRLRQALINIVGNAIKFTDQGSVSLKVGHRGQIATFEVRDTGPGIAPEDLGRIFEPYEQLAAGGESGHRGVGLGLPISKAIIGLLGGNLEVESVPGEGSCFRITLMLSEPAGASLPEVVRRKIVGYEGPLRSILLVDDDADQRNFLESFLVDCGFEVASAASGEAAVEACIDRGYDLAVLDISMPGITGWEAAARIREKLGRQIVIVMASANAQEFQRPEYHNPVHDHFLVKPYRLQDMSEAIGGLLNLSWKWEATGGPDDVAAAAPRPGGLPAKAMTHVEQLRERIQIGHVRGIESEIAMLANAAPAHGRLVTALYSALDEFDLAGMMRLLEDA